MALLPRGSDGLTDFTPEQHAEAKSLGYKFIQLSCEEPVGEVRDQTGVGTFLYVQEIPRIGETIILQDGKSGQVTDICFKIRTVGDTNFLTLGIPNVIVAVGPKSQIVRK